jgi:hypothetical protein
VYGWSSWTASSTGAAAGPGVNPNAAAESGGHGFWWVCAAAVLACATLGFLCVAPPLSPARRSPA